MWNKQKPQKVVFLWSNLQTYYHFKLDLKKMDQHTGGKWLIHGSKCHKDNQLQRPPRLMGIPSSNFLKQSWVLT